MFSSFIDKKFSFHFDDHFDDRIKSNTMDERAMIIRFYQQMFRKYFDFQFIETWI